MQEKTEIESYNHPQDIGSPRGGTPQYENYSDYDVNEKNVDVSDHGAMEEQVGTKRGLSARHIQMISLGGAIGTGLFLNSGGNIASAGPAGALIAYIVIGFMVFCIMTCLGEMATYMPISGSFNLYASKFVDPALGFALGWNYWFSWAVTIATELSAAATIIDYWFQDNQVVPDAAWSAIFLVLILGINTFGVRVYGELEYWFAMIKILLVIVFLIVALLVTTGAVGGHTIGFSYWKDPGAFNNGVLGTVGVLLSAGFSFQGTEIVGVTAGEAKNPHKSVPRAIRNVFWRILIFFVLTMLFIGMCVPYDLPELSTSSDAATASFTIIFNIAGIGVGAHIVNAVVLSSVLSAANSSLYTCSRTLMALARDGKAPALFSRTTRWGAPVFATLASSIIGFACVFVSLYRPDDAFVWFLSITAVTGFISWTGIAAAHLRFRKAYVYQGRDLNELPYRALWFPFSPIFAIVLTVLIVLAQGYGAFYPEWDTTTFFIDYIGIAPFILTYGGYKIFRRSKVIPLGEVDLDTGRYFPTAQDEIDNENDLHRPWYKKMFSAIV
ncbi:amino acid permease/ SLC12A domain-containing protein [Umbelopsis sp. AD052]|nr:amino acid permease/ SLC12A domain-containing protein [Umbelopsis sp. AD052]